MSRTHRWGLPLRSLSAGGLGLLAAVCACHGSPPEYPGPPACEVGSGVLRFLPLPQGQIVPLIYGPQGGYHLWGAARVKWVASRALRVRYTLTLADQTPVSSVSEVVDLEPPEPDELGGLPGIGWGETLGSLVYVPDPRAIDGKAVQMRLDALDVDGRGCSDERSIIPRL